MKPSQFFFVECDLDAYNILTTITQKAIENAGVVAETYNGLNGVLTAIKDKANAIASKIAAGGKPTASEIATLQQAAKQGIAQMQASLDAMRAGLGDKINAETAKLLQTKINDLTTTAQDIATPATALVAAQALAKIDPVAVVKEVKKLQPLVVEYNGKSFSSKGATIKMQPGDMAGVMQSTGDIPLMCGFDLKNTVEGDPITWHLETSNGTVLPLEAPLRTSASSKDTYLGIKWPNGQNSLKLSVVSGERSLHFTLLKPDWKVSGLQIADGGRVAKTGETLYLVKAPLKDEKATVSWTSNIDPMLLNKHYFVNGTQTPLNLTAHKIPYTYSESPSKTTYRLNALGYDESVKVEVVDVNYSKKALAGKTPTFLNELNKINRLLGPIKKYLPCEWSTVEDFSNDEFEWSNATYNEEDKKTRIAYEVNETTFKLSKKDIIKVKCGLPVVAFGFPIASVYLGISLDASISVIPKQKINYETKVDNLATWMDSKGEGSITFKPKFGVESKAIPGVELDANINIGMGAKFRYPYETENNNKYRTLGLFPFIDRTMLDLKATMDIPILGKKDFKMSWMIIDTKLELKGKQALTLNF